MDPHIWLIVTMTMWGGHPMPSHTAFLEGPMIAADCTKLKEVWHERLYNPLTAATVVCHYSLTRPVKVPLPMVK
jgi:hypothetical protein